MTGQRGYGGEGDEKRRELDGERERVSADVPRAPPQRHPVSPVSHLGYQKSELLHGVTPHLVHDLQSSDSERDLPLATCPLNDVIFSEMREGWLQKKEIGHKARENTERARVGCLWMQERMSCRANEGNRRRLSRVTELKSS